MVKLNALPTDSEPTPISEQEEGTLEDQLDAAMEQPVAEGLVVADVELEPVVDTPPPVAEAACDEKGEGEEPAKEEVPTITKPLTYEEELTKAERGLADSVVAWELAKDAVKDAKINYDEAAIIIKGLRRALPLFDQQPDATPNQEEAKTVEYSPPLEKGQVRVRIIEMENAPGELDDAPTDGSVIICHHDPNGLLYWTDVNDPADANSYFTENDRYEVLEDWPDDVAGAVLHLPPIQFGPETVETDDAPAADPDVDPVDPVAWRAVSTAVALTGLASGRLASLIEVAPTMGDLEDFRAEISQGKKKWPKGIGPAAITVIEDLILNWLRDNQ